MLSVGAQFLFGDSTKSFFDSWWVRLPLVTLIVAGATFIVLFTIAAFREPFFRYVRRYKLLQMGLHTVGTLAAVALLVEVFNAGYALIVPGIILGVLGILFLVGKVGDTITVVELMDSCGVVFVAWLLLLGWKQTYTDIKRFFQLWVTCTAYGGHYLHSWQQSAFASSLHVLAEHAKQKHLERMQNASYRKMDEEKWKLREEKWKVEGRLREIEDRQEYFVQHGMKWE